MDAASCSVHYVLNAVDVALTLPLPADQSRCSSNCHALDQRHPQSYCCRLQWLFVKGFFFVLFTEDSKNNVQGAYKLSEDFVKPYFHKY